MFYFFDASPVTVTSVVCKRWKSFRHIDYTHTLCKSTKRKCHIVIINITYIMEMKLIKEWQSVFYGNIVKHLPCYRIERPCYCLSYPYISMITATCIWWSVYKFMVIYYGRRRIHTWFKSGSIVNKRFYRTSWLSCSKICPIILVIFSTTSDNRLDIVCLIIDTYRCPLKCIFSSITIFFFIKWKSVIYCLLKFFLFLHVYWSIELISAWTYALYFFTIYFGILFIVFLIIFFWIKYILKLEIFFFHKWYGCTMDSIAHNIALFTATFFRKLLYI